VEDPRFWVVDSRAAQSKRHLEYHCHAKAEKQPNGSNIVKPRKFEFDEPSMTHRVYNMDLKKIPEAWIWMVFSALVECGLAMETDCDASSEDRSPKETIHRDLKPANVFLGLAIERSWPLSQQPRLGDFGLAIETYPKDSGNPLRWKGKQPGHRANTHRNSMTLVDMLSQQD
jgi:serine/threonine protein kinase